MHHLRDFIDDRHGFYNQYYNNIKPDFHNYRGMQNAFTFGSATDYAIKCYYLNKDNMFNTDEFASLNKTDRAMVHSLVNAYIDKYKGFEHFHDFQVPNWKVPISIRGLKNNYLIYSSPDLVALTYFENQLMIIEIKTSGDKDALETLDFQTMTYAWASYRWNFKIPAGVIKRTIKKTRLKLKQKETEEDYIKRLVIDITDNENGKYFKSDFRPITKEMILEFEKYLHEIIKEFDSCLNKKYRYYKRTDAYWGL